MEQTPPLVSIIVPVYKVEKYLQRCIGSILTQTYENFELILIDDGSPDNCGEICDEYAQKDSRIKVIHQENAGVSSARNNGIETACGEYIVFVDSDDYVLNDYIEHFLTCGKFDLIVSGYNNDLPKVGECTQKTIAEFLNERILDLCIYSPIAKLYKREILIEYNIRFNTNVRYSEDRLFNFDYILHCNSIKILHESHYIYDLPESIYIKERYAEKYHLTIQEIIYTINCLENSFNKITTQFRCCISFNSTRYLISMYPLNNIIYKKLEDEYYQLYTLFYPNNSITDYYNDTLVSPIYRALVLIKESYKYHKTDNIGTVISWLHNKQKQRLPIKTAKCGRLIQLISILIYFKMYKSLDFILSRIYKQ